MRVNIGAPFSGMLLLYPKEGKNRAAGSTPIIRSHNSMTKLLIPLAFLTVAVPLFFIVLLLKQKTPKEQTGVTPTVLSQSCIFEDKCENRMSKNQ